MAERGEVITLQDEDGHTHEFNLVDVVEVDEQRYAILQPADASEPAVVFRVEDETLVAVDDEVEFRKVAEAVEALDEYDEVEIEGDAERGGADGAGDGRKEGGGPVM